MSLPVHLVPSLEGAHVGDTVEVRGDEAHHAVAVRRMQVADELVLTDGAGGSAHGEVTATGKRLLSVTLTSLAAQERPQPSLTVVQALPKGDRGELAVQVLTEIGADVIVPWSARRSVATWRGERAVKSHAKWSATAREAAKQSRRSWHPSVEPLTSTEQVAELLRGAELSVVLHEDATTALSDVAPPSNGTMALVVGPEGGISAEELVLFTGAGACTARMGREVLRTSTAGVAAAAALLARTPRWSVD